MIRSLKHKFELYKKDFIIETCIKELEVIYDVPIICCICQEGCKGKVKFINCKKKGIQSINYGRDSECCRDKPICFNCRQTTRKNCPFCRNHTLFNVKKKRMNKKGKTWAEREVIRKNKIAMKKDKKERQERQDERQRIKRMRLLRMESRRFQSY